MNKLKTKKPIIVALIIIGLLAVAGAVFALITLTKEDPVFEDQELQEAFEAQRDYEFQEPALDPNASLEIDQQVSSDENQKAKESIEKQLENETSLDIYSKNNLYASLYEVCRDLKDLECLERIITYQESLGEDADLYAYVFTASVAKDQGDQDKSKTYYSKALVIINNNGGEEFVNTANETAQEKLNYKEISDGAQ